MPLKDPTVHKSDTLSAVSFYKQVPLSRRLDVTPFVVGYAILLGILFQVDEEQQVWAQLAIPFFGMLHVVFALGSAWNVNWKCFVQLVHVYDIKEATLAKMVPASHHGSAKLCPISTATGSFRTGEYFVAFNKQQFWYVRDEHAFETIDFPVDLSVSAYMGTKGMSSESALALATGKYGLNKFDIPIPTFQDLYKEHAVAPFFVFQMFCVALWCLDEYWYYSVFTLFMLLTFEATVVKQRLRNLVHIRSLAPPAYKVRVYRKTKWETVLSTELVPGDLLALERPENDETPVPCDIVLVNGTCIVNEAMLTGESKPQAKESIALRKGEDIVHIDTDKRHIVYGGTRIVQSTSDRTADNMVAGAKDAPKGAAVGYVMRTGFETSQGRLVRTILFSAERATAHSKEVFVFILCLLVFALAAAYYVFTEGLKDPKRSRYKLVLECVLVITSVVPPELPMELSLAVNASLIALAQMKVWCTEPFRIPFAGRLDVCCFDKTGTLTQEELKVEGVVGIDESNPARVCTGSDIPEDTTFVLAGCHGLVHVDGELIGDPMEKTVLDGIDWTFSKNEIACPKKGQQRSLKVVKRHPFLSQLKRSSVVVSLEHVVPKPVARVLVKGAPETIEGLLSKVPAGYTKLYRKFALEGKRVLALAWKDVDPSMDAVDIRRSPREWAESDLTFAGFLILHCPLKKQSLRALRQLSQSGHKNVMITGDNPLTGCQIASELEMNRGLQFLILSPLKPDIKLENGIPPAEAMDQVVWRSPRDDGMIVSFDADAGSLARLAKSYALCVAGPALTLVSDIKGLVSHTDVFARVSPVQKELILATMKRQGHTTMMCGDGTNDVGALKQAHVGIALLNRDVPIFERKSLARELTEQARKRPMTLQEKMDKLKKEAEAMDEPMIRLGDASIAAPFTSKSSSPEIVASIIKQGRCTLVTTMQMYKILALNCLVSAYSLSVLYLDGVKYGDTQMTLQGMTIAILFLFISRSKPLDKLAKEKPISRIFCAQTIASILGQFALHLMCLILAVNMAHEADPEYVIDLEGDFKPNILNTVVYLMTACMLISIFATNYQGHPHMQGVSSNKPMLYAVVGELILHAVLALELSDDLKETFELSTLPSPAFKSELCQLLVFDFVATFLFDRLCKKLFPASK